MEQIEEFEYGASLAFYSGRRILMVKRHGLPQFPYPVAPGIDYLITPEQLRELWQGPAVSSGRAVFVRDLAKIVDGPEEPSTYVRFGAGAAARERVSAGAE